MDGDCPRLSTAYVRPLSVRPRVRAERTTVEMTRITVVGLGVMGQALARALLDAHFSVTVWNRSPEKAKDLMAGGARLADTLTESITASDTIVVCVSTHQDTYALLCTEGISLVGKSIIELSSGTPADANRLVDHIHTRGSTCLIGMILSYPSGIGSDRASITTAGDESVWSGCQAVLGALAKNLSYISDDPRALATMFSALFIPRQAYFFGMVYGALLFEKSRLPVQAYLDMLPQLNPILEDYLEVVQESISTNDYTNPQASLETIRAAYRDALAPFESVGASDEIPRLMAKIVEDAVEAGYGGEKMTAVIKLLRQSGDD